MKLCGSRKALISSLVLLIFLSMQAVICCASSKGGTCNIALITIDTLRADHVSCYGYERTTTPVIDAIAEGGIVCSTVYAPSSWTAPSMASLFTSVYPINHGVVHGIGYTRDNTLNVQEIFSPDLVTLAQVLKAHGYSTFGVSSNPHLSEKFKFDRGFDYFICLPFEDAAAVNKAAYAWEDSIRKAEKFFLWIHYIDPHYPYTAQKPWIDAYASEAETRALLNMSPQSWRGLKTLVKHVKDDPKLLKHLVALYDSEINFADAHLGMLMEKFGLYKDTLVLITSDHGEEFLEHGETGHGRNLYQQTLHVPLIVKLPEDTHRSVLNRPLSLVDVMPTILEIVGLNAPATATGRSFRRKDGLFFRIKEILTGVDKDYIYAELDTTATMKAVFDHPWKYIYNCRDKTGQLYNLVSDPLELNDLALVHKEQNNRLKNHLLRWVDTAPRYPATRYDVELSAEEKEKLRGLGYLQ